MKLLVCLLSLSAAVIAATPAEKAIEQANASIAANPKQAEGYNALSLAYSRRARETSDPSYYDKALDAVQKSVALEADNFEALKAKTWAMLGKHEFAAALDLAKKLNAKIPDDLLVYGFLTDAHIELGNYAEAEKAAQFMLDLRPGTLAGLTRAAYLRELFGDLDGSIDLMRQALQRLRPEDTEDQAWILTQVAHLHLVKGDAVKAERVLDNALKIFPDYHYALGNLGKAKLGQKQYDAAVGLFRKRYEVAPHPENLYDVGVALHKAGKLQDAKKTFAEFEASARKEMDGPDNSNRELIFYYLDYAKKPAEGLRIARREAEQRQDVFTLDAYAWALHKSGKDTEARAQMKKAVDVGVLDRDLRARAKVLGFTGAEVAQN